jgi:multidrug resistance protein, MATE family
VKGKEGVASFVEGPGGAREVLRVGYPLILAQLSFTLQTFLDRLFLTWYSTEAVAGAVAGLFTIWTLMGLFIGTGEYLTTFIAQYKGSGRPERIGPAVWQGIYFSLGAGAFVAALVPLADPVFEWAGHAPALRAHEVTYARILMLGAFPTVLMATLSSFFAGRGQTVAVLRVNILATVVNAGLDYLWIFGNGGFPRMGVTGAARSTVVSQAVGALTYLAIIWRKEYRERYRTLAGWRFESGLFARLLRFGLPTGLQYSLEVLAFSLFLILVGRIGTDELAASGIAFNLNMIVFMPMMGLALGVSSLVGRHLGAEDPRSAERTVRSALVISFVYMSACGLLYVFGSGLLLAPYAAGSDPRAFAGIARMTPVLLCFVALYSIFDMMNVIYAAGLKGAGDTVYPLLLTVVLSWGAMLVPAYVACLVQGGGVYVAWCFATLYVVLLGLLMRRRFRAGGWKQLRVVEPATLELQGRTT